MADKCVKFQRHLNRKDRQHMSDVHSTPLLKRESSLQLSSSIPRLTFENAYGKNVCQELPHCEVPNVSELVDHLLGITGWDLETALSHFATPATNRYAVSTNITNVVYSIKYISVAAL